MAGGTEVLKRRVARLIERDEATLRAVVSSLTRDEYRRLFAALGAAGAPLPDGH